ncbi:MAG: hypothetical protein WC781_03005 [Candidatus Pacearchaeota archaeon]|jgi:hypothetical protein
MFSLKEIGSMILATIILTFVVSYNSILASPQNFINIFINFIFIAIVVLSSVIAKKLVAYYYEAKIEHQIWMIQRFGIKKQDYFKKPIPMGVIFPFILSLISMGYIWWMAVLEFDVFSTTARAAKRHGIYRFTEMADSHIGFIAAAGTVASLIVAVICYIANFPEISRLCIYYSAFSLVPYGNLDGTKIFIGSRILWISLIILVAIFFGFTFVP